jgi:hypothetical protein
MPGEVVHGAIALPAPDVDDESPAPGRDSYVCPNCHAYAQQHHGRLSSSNYLEGWSAARCQRCKGWALFRGDALIWPPALGGPAVHPDAPHIVATIYAEAQAVAPASPRSAAALMRLALEQLVNDLEPGDDSLHDKTGRLRARGLDQLVVDAMDVLRVFGNNGAHIGEIDLADDRGTVDSLFQILNMVVEHVITRRKAVETLSARFTPGQKTAIEQRNRRHPLPPTST